MNLNKVIKRLLGITIIELNQQVVIYKVKQYHFDSSVIHNSCAFCCSTNLQILISVTGGIKQKQSIYVETLFKTNLNPSRHQYTAHLTLHGLSGESYINHVSHDLKYGNSLPLPDVDQLAFLIFSSFSFLSTIYYTLPWVR